MGYRYQHCTLDLHGRLAWFSHLSMGLDVVAQILRWTLSCVRYVVGLSDFLHHTEPDIPWYREEEWTFLKGALSTIDRDYGFINHIHHDIGTHVAHHIFLNIPHYNLKRATEAIKPVLGNYFRKSEEPIVTSLWRSCTSCHYVPDTGTKVYYTHHEG